MSVRRNSRTHVSRFLLAILAACSAPGAPTPPTESGTLTVSNETRGGAFDVDGFIVSVQGASSTRVELNATAVIEGLPTGAHMVELAELAPNCRANDGPLKGVTLQGGATTELHFDVTCTPPPELARLRIVYARTVKKARSVHGASIVSMNGDGSGVVQLTNGDFHDGLPDLSPDGRRIVFQSNREGDPDVGPAFLYVMNADGSGQTRLSDMPAYHPDWSPDGREIAYVGVGDHWGGPVLVLDVGSGRMRALTTVDPLATVDVGAVSPAWSPDGTRVAFGRGELLGGTHTSIVVMNADGTGEVRVTQPRLWGGMSPVWSPDGTMIAFDDFEGPLQSGIGRIKVINADGTGVVTLLESSGPVWKTNDWSPSGELLLLAKGGDLYLLRLADRTLVRLTADHAYDGGAKFWPSPRPGADP